MISKCYSVQFFHVYHFHFHLLAHQEGKDLLKSRGARHKVKTEYFLTVFRKISHISISFISRFPEFLFLQLLNRFTDETGKVQDNPGQSTAVVTFTMKDIFTGGLNN